MFFITGVKRPKLDKRKEIIDLSTHCFGYETNKDKAIDSLDEIYQKDFGYIVIEKYSSGVQMVADEEYWFEYKDGKYIAIEKPKVFLELSKAIKGICNFAMG